MSARTGPYRNTPMERHRAYDTAIAFGRDTGLPCQPKPNGEGFDAVIPMEWLESLGVGAGKLEPAPTPPPPRPTSAWEDSP